MRTYLKVIAATVLLASTEASAELSPRELTSAKAYLAQLRLDTSACASEKAFALKMAKLGTDERIAIAKSDACLAKSKILLSKTKSSLKKLVSSDQSALSALKDWYTTYSSTLERMVIELENVDAMDNKLEAVTGRFEASLEF